MSGKSRRLAEADRRIRDATLRIDLYRNRIARRHRNPALAEQAEQLLPLMLAHLKELVCFRRNLATAIDLQKRTQRKDDAADRQMGRLPRLPGRLR